MEFRPVVGGHANEQCIMWDNLSLHKTAYFMSLTYDRPSNNFFIVVDFPLYRPKIDIIEYVLLIGIRAVLSSKWRLEYKNIAAEYIWYFCTNE